VSPLDPADYSPADDAPSDADLTSVRATKDSDGTFRIEGDRVRFTPATDQLGLATGEYILTERGIAVPGIIEVTVTTDPDGPQSVTDAAFVRLNGAADVPVLDNDTAMDGPIRLEGVGSARNGTAQVRGSDVRFSLTEGDLGSAQYRTRDAENRLGLGTIEVRRRPDAGETIRFMGADSDPHKQKFGRSAVPVAEGDFETPIARPQGLDIAPDGRYVVVGGGVETSRQRKQRLNNGPDKDAPDVDWIGFSSGPATEITYTDIPVDRFHPAAVAVAADGRIAVSSQRGAVYILDETAENVLETVRVGIDPDFDPRAETQPEPDDDEDRPDYEPNPAPGVGAQDPDFFGVHGLAWLPDGALLFTDYDQGTILRWAGGAEGLFAGGPDPSGADRFEGAPIGAELLQIRGIDVAPNGAVWAAHAHGVSRIAENVELVLARPSLVKVSGGVRLGDLGRLSDVEVLADNRLLFSDIQRGNLFRFNGSNVVKLEVKGPEIEHNDETRGSKRGLDRPDDIAVTANGDLLVTDSFNDRVLMVGDAGG